jgi:hypothetical protein
MPEKKSTTTNCNFVNGWHSADTSFTNMACIIFHFQERSLLNTRHRISNGNYILSVRLMIYLYQESDI